MRLKQLHKAQRWVDEAVFYQECWRPELNRVLYNTEMMQNVVHAFMELGMWQEAYDLQLDINAIYTRDNEDNLDGLVHLARILNQIGKPIESLETIQYGRARPQSTPYRNQFDYLEGRAQFKLANLDDARRAFAKAAVADETKTLASLWLNFTRAEAGLCEEAKPALKAFHASSQNIEGLELTREEILLAYNRCLLNEGDYPSVIQIAKEISLMTDEPIYNEEAGYQSSLAAYRNASETDLPSSFKADPFWQQMIEVKKETQAVEDRARGRNTPASTAP